MRIKNSGIHNNINTHLPIVKHSNDATEPCYLILARISKIDDILEKIDIGMIRGIISTAENLQQFHNKNIALIAHDNPGLLWSELCHQQFPLLSQNSIAVTGTSGKTSTTWFIYNMLLHMNKNAMLIGSIGIFQNGVRIADTINATPDSYILHKYTHDFLQQNGSDSFCIYETSSIALEQNRIANIAPKVGVWINLSHDHLDYHHTMEKYHECKLMLGNITEEFFVHKSIEQNKYQKYGEQLISAEQKDKLIIKAKFNQKIYEISADIFGLFQANNIISAIVALQKFFPVDEIIQHANKLTAPAGRMQKVGKFVIDHSHKPEALRSALLSIRECMKAEPLAGKVWIIAGCGGNRDATKRPIMGAIMEELSDIAIITNDNPRNEDPAEIAKQVSSGFVKKEPITILNREEAIEYAHKHMQPNDLCLIAGKGNETYQEFENGRKVYFSDLEVAERL